MGVGRFEKGELGCWRPGEDRSAKRAASKATSAWTAKGKASASAKGGELPERSEKANQTASGTGGPRKLS